MMATCVICNKENAQWQCSVCDRAIGPNCARTADGKVYCIDHVPAQSKAMPKSDLSALRKTIWAMLFLTIGTGAILYVVQSYVASAPPIEVQPVATILQLFQTTGLLVVEGLAGLLVLLVIIYAIMRRLRK